MVAREQSKNKQKPRELSTQPNINCKVMEALAFMGSLFSLMKVTDMWHLLYSYIGIAMALCRSGTHMYDIMISRNPTEARFDTSGVSDSRGMGKSN